VGSAEPAPTVFLLAWSGRSEVILVLAALAAIYVTGWSRLRWRRAGRGQPVARRQPDPARRKRGLRHAPSAGARVR